MIPPREQWGVQIEVTNRCPRQCSNCTRLLAHAREPFFVDAKDFARACEALAEFPVESDPTKAGDPPGRKVIGMMGGEPLCHPEFRMLCRIFREHIPQRVHRGLWTAVDLRGHADEHLIRQTFGYVNNNRHVKPSVHQPVLVGIQEVLQDEQQMWALIEACPLQRQWCSAITPKGFFFCEVAGSLDLVFDGPGGLPVTPGCWRHDLADYRDQIERWCPRCGICLPLEGRLDREEIDDVTPGNLTDLRRLGSPRVEAGRVQIFHPAAWRPPADWQPLRYLR